jgi:predicted TIM-barrel fold metal-dependent hydrolase
MTEGVGGTEGSRYVVISTDSHDEPPNRPDKLVPYVDDAHRERYTTWLDANPLQPGSLVDGRNAGDYAQGVSTLYKARILSDSDPEWVDRAIEWSRYEEQPDMTDPHARVAQVESLGAVAEVVNPSSSLNFNSIFAPDRDMVEAVRWAYLRWFADFCGAVPGRLAGTIPIDGSCRAVAQEGHDLETALVQVRWGREHGLTGGVQAPVPANDVPEIFDPYWEPLWALCSELEIPLVFHGGCHGIIDTMTLMAADASTRAVAILESGFASKRNFWHLMVAGVFDRYPNLKFVLVEQHITSMPGILSEFDHVATTTAPNAGSFGTLKALKLTPTEYWLRHGLFGAPFLRPEETQLMRDSHIGLSTVTWGADYPHVEGAYPDFKRGLQFALGGLPEEEIRAIVGGTAAEVFGFDLAALQKVADRCGPTVEELSTPLSDEEIPRYSFSGAYDLSYQGAA